MSDNKYDDSEQGGYSYEEKLGLVAAGLMSPTDIGLPDTNEGRAEAQKQLPPQPVLLEPSLIFECAEVPPALRAHWARKELKIEPANPRKFEADWAEEHANEHLMQARFQSGKASAAMQKLVSEPLMGMVEIMRAAADAIEAKVKDQLEAERAVRAEMKLETNG